MRFLFGFGLGLLIPMAARALMASGKPVVLESIRGGLAKAGVEEASPAQMTEAAEETSADSTAKKQASSATTNEKPSAEQTAASSEAKGKTAPSEQESGKEEKTGEEKQE